MIILYIPFSMKENGDLSLGVNEWVGNHCKNFDELIKVIYHQDEFDDELIENNVEVYILAHGNGNSICNLRTPDEAVHLDIPTLAYRVNSDLTLIAHKTTRIHLYFCGTNTDNLLIANRFQALWYGREHHSVHYYSGSISPPDESGQKLSVLEGNSVRVESTQGSLEKTKTKLFDLSYSSINIKDEYQRKFIKQANERRHHKVRDLRSKSRYSLFHNNRETVMEVESANTLEINVF